MSLARVDTFAIDGVEARRIWVEADIRRGLSAFAVVGLADKAVREARERVRAALVNSGFVFPQERITVNLAPAYLRKVGPGFDLPLAVAILAASGQIAPDTVSGCAVVGELSLTGEVRAVRGALAVAEGVRRHRLARLLLPRGRAREAALVPELEVLGVEHLQEAVEVLRGDRAAAPVPDCEPDEADALEEPDLSDVRGHNGLIPALEVAAAGGHNLFLHGPPGTGKTMLARRLPSLLPPMTPHEAIEVTRLHNKRGRASTDRSRRVCNGLGRALPRWRSACGSDPLGLGARPIGCAATWCARVNFLSADPATTPLSAACTRKEAANGVPRRGGRDGH